MSPHVSSEKLSGFEVLGKIMHQCTMKNEMFKCFKVQAIKVAERATKARSLDIVDGVKLVSNGRLSKSMRFGLSSNETKLDNLDDEQLNNLLGDSTKRFLDTHQLEIKVPDLVEEGRKRKGNRGGNNAALYWALAIKGTFLAVAYKGIAIMSGLALIMGKMALMLTAILGLKKLVSSGQESTTFEIIKQPKYSESHTHSTSYEDDHHKAYDRNDWNGSTRIIKTYL
ncbi:unnamed protein product [Phaedon cochleariae]|uniref:Uncharacterized protein n=1 Tax=Phaedon cochleariae TaxID=80249 RepID=A0A9N9X1Y0_PHACE|nr:unnamed protein product [Phaedon cochleariae]